MRAFGPRPRPNFDELYRAASDPLIWEQHPEPDRYKAAVFRKYFDALGGAHALRFVDRVVFVVGENNVRSQKALEKIGARFVGLSERPGNVVFEIVRT